MLDTLTLAREMTAGGIDRDQAEVIANAMCKAVDQGDYVNSAKLGTGLAEVHTEIAELRTELRTEIAELRTELRTEIAELRTEMHTEIAGLRTEMRTEIASLETRLIRWMIGTGLATAALVVGILRLFAV